MNQLAIPFCFFRQIWFHFNVERIFPTIPGYLAMGAIIFHAWEGWDFQEQFYLKTLMIIFGQCLFLKIENLFFVAGIGRLRPTSVSSRFPQWLIISPIWSPNGWWERWCLSYIVIFWSFLVVKSCWLTWQRPLCEVGFGDMVPTKSFLGYGESLFGKLQVLSKICRHLASKYLWWVSRILLLQMLVCVTYCAMGLALLAMCMSLIQV